MAGSTERELRSRVAATWRDLGAVTDPTPVCETLVDHYSEPHRVYHDLSHVRDCMATFDECRGRAGRPGEVAAALLFHDVVYRPGDPENEELSAGVADHTLREAGLPDEVRARVCEMILDTRHDREPGPSDSRLVMDIDLAGLALPPGDFLLNTRRLLEEFRRFGIEDGGPRIAAFLLRLTEDDWIYQTPDFREHREKRARANLSLAIRELREGTLGSGDAAGPPSQP